ncbi:uncharacterized protein [Palaemon carinicauda]|uniref:uncharacterized protein isoform X2 n=1 Tax=Palaemon carinicauda TaxID=392227 RepID=UPI0035B64120
MHIRETEDRRGSNIRRTKMRSITTLLCLVALVGSAYGLSCPRCDKELLCSDEPTEESCAYGRVYTPCHCCLECTKGPGEVCGGPWGYSGKCANGYKCERVPGVDEGWYDRYDYEGICQEDGAEKSASTTDSPAPTTGSPLSMTSSDASGLSCLPCDPVNSPCRDEPTEESCPYGRVNDTCNCCLECARGPGEDCGGPWGVTGTCATGYTCERIPGGYEDSVGYEGICQEAGAEESASTTDSPAPTTGSPSSTTGSPSSTTPSE